MLYPFLRHVDPPSVLPGLVYVNLHKVLDQRMPNHASISAQSASCVCVFVRRKEFIHVHELNYCYYYY